LEEIDSNPIYVAGQNFATSTLLLQPSNRVKESMRGKMELSRLSRNNCNMESNVKQLGLIYHGHDGKRFTPTGMSKFSTSFDNMKCLCKGRHQIVKDQRLVILLTDDSLPPRLGYNSSCINVVRYLESSSFDDIKASLPLICNGLLKSTPPKVTIFLNFTNFLKDVDAHSAFQMCERIARIIETLMGGRFSSNNPESGLLIVPILSPISNLAEKVVIERSLIFREILSNLSAAVDVRVVNHFEVYKSIFSNDETTNVDLQTGITTFFNKNSVMRIDRDVSCISMLSVPMMPLADPASDNVRYPCAADVIKFLKTFVAKIADLGYAAPVPDHVTAGIMQGGFLTQE
ncbi:MAG: hypothetical protein AAGJ80_19825, partial [Cyanobacteria bacterium J06553_1]